MNRKMLVIAWKMFCIFMFFLFLAVAGKWDFEDFQQQNKTEIDSDLNFWLN